MKKDLFILLIGLAGLAACQQKDSAMAPQPNAVFLVKGADTSNHVITVATYDKITLINKSSNGDAYVWHLGNDSTSIQQQPVIMYPTAGNYTLTLTVLTKDGQKATASKQVKVLNRVIKQVRINGIFADQIQSSTPTGHDFTNAKVWAVVKLGGNNMTYPLVNHSFNAPVIYQTPVITNYDPSKAPYTFDVPGRLLLDFAALDGPFFAEYGYKGIGYGLELYGQDSTGTYLIFTSYASFIPLPQEGAITWTVADIQRNTFIAHYGGIDVICDYE